MPDRGAARAPRLVLLDRRAARARDARRVPARPVLQPARTRARTSARPAPRSGGRPTGGSRTSSPASAPAARSPASRRYLKAQNPDVQIIGADPEGSVYSGGTGRPYLVEGVGEDFWPTTYDPSLVDRVVDGERRRLVPGRAARHARGGPAHRRVGRHRGARGARSSARELGPDAVVVVLLPDSGRGYLSKIFDDEWMFDTGFLRGDGPDRGRRARGEGRPIARPRARSRPTSRCATRSRCMRDAGVSQLVVASRPGAAARGEGGDRARSRELELMDLAFRDPTVLDRPVARGDGARRCR